MKHQFLFSTLAMLLSSSLSVVAQWQPANQANLATLRGAYTMFSQVLSTPSGDSVLARHQLKLLTGKYVMYAHRRAQDSLANFGIGTYRIENGKLVETIFYSDEGPQNSTKELTILLEPAGYRQVLVLPDTERGSGTVLTEDYKKFGKKMKTPLDGAWQQTKKVSVSADGKAVVDSNITQFKVFEAGNFIWANTIRDNTTQQYLARYGFGTFEMLGPNKAAEINLSSTYAADLVGKRVVMELVFLANDTFEQSISYPDGSKLIEVYKRLQ